MRYHLRILTSSAVIRCAPTDAQANGGFNVRVDEVGALEQQELALRLGQHVGEAVAEVGVPGFRARSP